MKSIPVVILCGGYGTRMKEETEFRPKPLVPIGGMPMLVHIMNIYYNYGYKNFILPLGYKGDMIKEYFLNYRFSGDFNLKIKKGKENEISHITVDKTNDFNITFIDTGVKTQTGSRIKKLEDYIRSISDMFMLTYGDSVSNINISELVNFHFSHKKIATVTGVKEPFRYGMITEEKDLVTVFGEKKGNNNNLINGGFFVLDNKIFDYIEDGNDIKFENSTLSALVADEELMVYKHYGQWACADMAREVDDLNDMYDKGDAFWIG